MAPERGEKLEKDWRTAREIIERERKHSKDLFYTFGAFYFSFIKLDKVSSTIIQFSMTVFHPVSDLYIKCSLQLRCV